MFFICSSINETFKCLNIHIFNDNLYYMFYVNYEILFGLIMCLYVTLQKENANVR